MNELKSPFPWFGTRQPNSIVVKCKRPNGCSRQAALTSSTFREVVMAEGKSSTENLRNQVILNASRDSVVAGRFWDKVQKRESGCWEWTASKANKGYGAFGIGGIVVKAHRVAFLWSGGVVPSGLYLMHSCDNPACVNPSHMSVGSKADNNADMCRKGRHRPGGSKTPKARCKYERGATHHHAKLTEDSVRNLRSDRNLGISFSQLAKKYQITSSCAYRIAKGLSWTHVT